MLVFTVIHQWWIPPSSTRLPGIVIMIIMIIDYHDQQYYNHNNHHYYYCDHDNFHLMKLDLLDSPRPGGWTREAWQWLRPHQTAGAENEADVENANSDADAEDSYAEAEDADNADRQRWEC